MEFEKYGEPQHVPAEAITSPEPPYGEPKREPPADDERVVYEGARSAAAAMAWRDDDTPTGRDGRRADYGATAGAGAD